MHNFAFLIAGDDHRALIGKRESQLIMHAYMRFISCTGMHRTASVRPGPLHEAHVQVGRPKRRK